MWISFRCKLGGKVDQFWMQINKQAIVALNVADSEIERLENKLELSRERHKNALAEHNKSKGIIATLEKHLSRLEMREDEHLKLQRQFGTVEAQLKSLEKQAVG
jgi:ribosome-binding ATPase YchF (GTP1/OBG family)